MLAAGLIEMPPVSKVMPLPTSATVLAFFVLRAPVGQPDQPRRARRTLADADHAAVARLGQCLLVEHLDLEAGGFTQSLCALGEFVGEQVAGRGVDEIAGGGDRGRDVGGALGVGLGLVLVSAASAVISRRPGVLRRGLVAAEVGEPVGAEDQSLDRGLRSRSDRVVTTASVPFSDRAATPGARRIGRRPLVARPCRGRPPARWPPAATARPPGCTCSVRPWRRAPPGRPRSRRRPRRPGTGSRRRSPRRHRRRPLTTGTISTARPALRLGSDELTVTRGGLIAGIRWAHECPA